MENDNYGSVGDRANVCARCFGKLVEYALTNTYLIKQFNLPTSFTAYPMEPGKKEPCDNCNTEIATGYIPSFPKEILKESRERV